MFHNYMDSFLLEENLFVKNILVDRCLLLSMSVLSVLSYSHKYTWNMTAHKHISHHSECHCGECGYCHIPHVHHMHTTRYMVVVVGCTCSSCYRNLFCHMCTLDPEEPQIPLDHHKILVQDRHLLSSNHGLVECQGSALLYLRPSKPWSAMILFFGVLQEANFTWW